MRLMQLLLSEEQSVQIDVLNGEAYAVDAKMTT